MRVHTEFSVPTGAALLAAETSGLCWSFGSPASRMAREREQKAPCCSDRMGRAASWGLSWLRLAVSNPAADRSLLAQLRLCFLSRSPEKAPCNGAVGSGLVSFWRSLADEGGPGAFLGWGAELAHKCAVEPYTSPWPKPEMGFSLDRITQFQEIHNVCSQCFKNHTFPQSKTKHYQSSIRWRCFPHGFHFSGK